MSTDPLVYILSCLRRAADNAYPWSLTPTEAGALVAEVERLRAQRVLDNEALARAWDEGRDAERGDVIDYLLAPGTGCDNAALAEVIESGEHRQSRRRNEGG